LFFATVFAKVSDVSGTLAINF